jgi:hypothetical protein
MRPYLAIIRDSFHEALVSRVLWILLVVTTLFLLALFPFGITEQAGWYLSDEDILNRDTLAAKIAAQGASPEASPGHRIWELLDESTRQSLDRQGDHDAGPARFANFARSLQGAIARRDFYHPSDWAKTPLPPAARALYAKGLADLPDDQVARFNRLALEAAFPEEIAPAPPKQLQLAYFRWELGLPLPVEPEQLFPAVNQLLMIALGILLGVGGVFVAVLVTASMIPQTFEAGPVDLLLSKPISRIGLFLAKFFGGCAFIAINAAYFICGLWLILGVRLGLWNDRLLWAIPLYLFLFAILYSVSALAGLIWRNAIVSVVLAVVFWFVCWSLGFATSLVEQLSLNPRRMSTIVPAGNTLIAVDRGDVFRWSDEEADWKKIFIGRDPPFPFPVPQKFAGPIYDPAGERMLAFRAAFPGFGPLQAANRLLIGKRADNWRREEGVSIPDGACGLLLGPQDDVLIASSQGIYRLEGDLTAKQPDINLFGLHLRLPERGGRFANVGPKMQLRPLESAAIDPQTGSIAIFDGFRLVVYHRDAKGVYRQRGDQSFERKQYGKVAIAGDQVFLALADGQIHRYSDELKPLDVVSSGAASLPDSATVSSDGRYLAIVFHNETLWLHDVREARPCVLPLVGQGDISAVAFDGPKMFVADRLSRVTEYDLDKLQRGRQWEGRMPLAEKIYRYALHPLYTVFPKPGQLNDTVNYLLTANDSQSGAVRLGDPQNARAKLDVWGPVWSNLAFLIVVLAVACGYIYRKDF